MGQQQGSNSVIIYDTETTFKSTPSPIDAFVLPFVSESFRMSRNLISSNTIRSSRNPQKPVRGNTDVSGDVTVELAPQHGRLLKHAFGSYTAATGVAGQWYTHTFKIGSMPAGLVIEKQFTDLDTPAYFMYNGCRINSFRFSAKPEGMIEASFSILGAKETVGAASMDAGPTDLGHTPWDGMTATITRGGASLGTVTEIDFTLENNLDGNTFVIDGTSERYSLPAGTAKVSGTLKALFDSTTLYDLAVDYTETTLTIAFTSGTGDGTSGNEKLTFYVDELVFKPQAPVIDGPTGVLVELPFEAYYNDAAEASAFRAILLSSTLAY